MQQAVLETSSYSLGSGCGYPEATVTPASLRLAVSPFLFQFSLVAALIGFGLFFDHAAGNDPPDQGVATAPADLAAERTSQVHRLAQWAVGSHDHAWLPFVVIDEDKARLFAFDPQGHFLGSVPVVLEQFGGGASRLTLPRRFVADSWQTASDGGIFLIAQGDSARGWLRVPGEFYREYLSPLTRDSSVGYVLRDPNPLEALGIDDLKAWLAAGLPQRGSTRRPS